MRRRQLDEAGRVFAKARELEPSWQESHRNLAVSRIAAEDLDGAIRALDEASEQREVSFKLAFELATQYESQGKVELAIAAYEAFLASVDRRDPTYLAGANNLAVLLATYRRDRESLERAGELSAPLGKTDLPAFLDTHGLVQLRLGRFDEAEASLLKAVSQAPTTGEFHYHLAKLYAQTEREELARDHLRLALASQSEFRGIEDARELLDRLGSS